ncbi:hypothetical protein [Marinobacterium aestuariivivens]|uniref:Uncharacterized protein n=1 Tax=Marinobacterium aestuariivivens TaxID=1698799 RepID=A0ABW1ZYP6_9GAMM
MDSGLPAWFAPDQWWPWMFEIWEPCGYTPEMPFGITMAEALVGLGGALVAATALMLIAGLRRD